MTKGRPIRWATIATVALTVGLLATTAVFALPGNQQETSAIQTAGTALSAVAGATADSANQPATNVDVIALYAARELELQQRLAVLVQAREEREKAYTEQINELVERKALLESALAAAQSRSAALTEQISTLESTRTTRAAAYDQQLRQAQATYEPRYAEMSVRLAEINAKLTEANLALGR